MKTVESKPRLNTKPSKRSVNGILCLDKPTGISSNAALQIVKRLYQARKAGHTGSLDPLASGMLPICFGQATKFSQFLLEADKIYEVTAKLGVRTTTSDSEGDVVAEKPVPDLSSSQLEAVLNHYRGEIQQVPSMFSALKYQGQPLYKLARQGITVPREPRALTIHELTVTALHQDTLGLYIHCSKGTYVRTLIDDIGEALGCGAHVTVLRRLAVGPYQATQMQDLPKLEQVQNAESAIALDQYLLPIESMLTHLPAVEISAVIGFYLSQGQSVMIAAAPSSGLMRLHLASGEFIGVGEVEGSGKVAPKRILPMRQ